MSHNIAQADMDTQVLPHDTEAINSRVLIFYGSVVWKARTKGKKKSHDNLGSKQFESNRSLARRECRKLKLQQINDTCTVFLFRAAELTTNDTVMYDVSIPRS